MATYTQAQRQKYGTVGSRYPIGDKTHAKLALAYINKGGLNREQKMAVIHKAHQMLKG